MHASHRPLHCAPLVLGVALAACTGTIGEPGGAPNDPSDPNHPNNPSNPGAPFIASESEARRLTRTELDNTVRDLLGDDMRPATQFLGEDRFTPYDGDYTVQLASRALVESLETMAEDIATRVLADPMKRARIVPCTPTGPGDAACFRTFITSFGRRALRRPLSEEEITAYLSLQQYSTEANQYLQNNFYTGVSLVLQAILQDPEFLYRIEIGTPHTTPGIVALTPYELATRMSYLLWGSTPDDTLLAEAESGGLADPAVRRASAERLLDDDRARSQLRRFHAMWLGYRAIPHGPQLTQAFDRETSALIDRTIFDRRTNYLELFSSTETHLDNFLADHYGLPRPASSPGWIEYGTSGRAGILSHGSVLAAFSKFTDTSPTQRGILVRNRLMCQPIDPPPPTVNADNPPAGSDPNACKKQRYLEHTQSTSCNACHSRMDPIGFGLEAFDVAGKFRAHDDGRPECAIDGQGELPGFGSFNGPAELAAKLLDSGILERCAVEQYYSFSVGRALQVQEAQKVDALASAFGAKDRVFTEMILELVAGESFALKKEGVAP